MSMFDNPVKATGKYAFSFTTFVWDHPWDNKDYAYCHDVNEEEGKKAYDLLSKKTGTSGQSMDALLKRAFGEKPDADAVYNFCKENSIGFDFKAVMI